MSHSTQGADPIQPRRGQGEGFELPEALYVLG